MMFFSKKKAACSSDRSEDERCWMGLKGTVYKITNSAFTRNGNSKTRRKISPCNLISRQHTRNMYDTWFATIDWLAFPVALELETSDESLSKVGDKQKWWQFFQGTQCQMNEYIITVTTYSCK